MRKINLTYLKLFYKIEDAGELYTGTFDNPYKQLYRLSNNEFDLIIYEDGTIHHHCHQYWAIAFDDESYDDTVLKQLPEIKQKYDKFIAEYQERLNVPEDVKRQTILDNLDKIL